MLYTREGDVETDVDDIQDAGHHRAIPQQDAPLWSNNYEFVWMRGYGNDILLVEGKRVLTSISSLQKAGQTKKSTINHHLSRFYPQIIGPHKRK